MDSERAGKQRSIMKEIQETFIVAVVSKPLMENNNWLFFQAILLFEKLITQPVSKKNY